MNIIHPSTPSNSYSLLLGRVADELLSDGGDDGRLSAAVTRLYSLCSSIAGMDERSSHAGDSDETALPGGTAISPRDAARCLLDYRRTSKFLRGLHAAVLEARRRFPGTTIEVLYAGCGPFAPLALPLTCRFRPDEIRFTLLDVHERSLDAARRIFRAFGAAAFVRDYMRCDAAAYRHGGPHPVHIVVAEAMQAGLEKEPQAAITMNLAPQLCPGGIFIPERIAVDCHLCDLTKEFTTPPAGADAADPSREGEGGGRVRVMLGRVLELAAGDAYDPPPPDGGGHRRVSLSSRPVLHVPEGVGGGLNLVLSTTVTVFGPIVLNDGESGLTCPRVLHGLGKVRGGMKVELTYHLGDRPGFGSR